MTSLDHIGSFEAGLILKERGYECKQSAEYGTEHRSLDSFLILCCLNKADDVHDPCDQKRDTGNDQQRARNGKQSCTGGLVGFV